MDMAFPNSKIFQGQVNLLLESIEEMRLNQQFTDVTIMCKGRGLPAHKLILAASSPFFQEKFVEAEFNNIINVEYIQPKIMEILLRFMNTGKIDAIDGDLKTAELLLETASRLKIDQALIFVWDILRTSITTENFINIWNLATKFGRKDDIDQILQFTISNFEIIRDTEAYLAMSYIKFDAFLNNIIIKSSHEDMLSKMILKWVKHDQCNRKTNIPVLFSRVNLSLLSDEYLADILHQKPILGQFPALTELLLSAASDRFVQQNSSQNTEMLQEPKQSEQKLSVIGLESNDVEKCLAIYRSDFETNQWRPRKIANRCLLYSSACLTHGTNVYILGGREYQHITAKDVVSVFDILTEEWKDLPKMNMARYDGSAAVLNECIYVVGGTNNYQILTSVERLDLARNEWTLMAPLNNSRGCLDVAAIHEKLYAVCRHCLCVYDSGIDQWSSVNVPDWLNNSNLTYSNVTSTDKMLYILWGHSLYQFDSVSKEWECHKHGGHKLPDFMTTRDIRVTSGGAKGRWTLWAVTVNGTVFTFEKGSSCWIKRMPGFLKNAQATPINKCVKFVEINYS